MNAVRDMKIVHAREARIIASCGRERGERSEDNEAWADRASDESGRQRVESGKRRKREGEAERSSEDGQCVFNKQRGKDTYETPDESDEGKSAGDGVKDLDLGEVVKDAGAEVDAAGKRRMSVWGFRGTDRDHR